MATTQYSQQCERATVATIAHLQSGVGLRPPASPEYVEALNKSGEVDPEGQGGCLTELKLLEEAGLDEGVGLDTFGLLHGHLQALAAQEARAHLQEGTVSVRIFPHTERMQICTNSSSSLYYIPL